MKTNTFDSTALGKSIAMLLWAELPADKKQKLAERIRNRTANQVKRGEAA